MEPYSAGVRGSGQQVVHWTAAGASPNRAIVGCPGVARFSICRIANCILRTPAHIERAGIVRRPADYKSAIHKMRYDLCQCPSSFGDAPDGGSNPFEGGCVGDNAADFAASRKSSRVLTNAAGDASVRRDAKQVFLAAGRNRFATGRRGDDALAQVVLPRTSNLPSTFATNTMPSSR